MLGLSVGLFSSSHILFIFILHILLVVFHFSLGFQLFAMTVTHCGQISKLTLLFVDPFFFLMYLTFQVDVIRVLVVKHVLLPPFSFSLGLQHPLMVLVVFIDDVLVDIYLLLSGIILLRRVIVNHRLEMSIEVVSHLTKLSLLKVFQVGLKLQIVLHILQFFLFDVIFILFLIIFVFFLLFKVVE